MRQHNLFRALKLMRPYTGYLALAFGGAVAEIAADLLQPWPLKLLIDSVIGQRPLPSAVSGLAAGLTPEGALLAIAGSVVVIAALNAAGSYAQDYYMPRISHWVMHDVRRRLYWHVQRLSLTYHDTRRTGDLMNTFTADVQAVRELIESALLGVLINVITLCGMVAIMCAMDWRFALFGLSISPLLGFGVYRLTRRIKEASRDVRKREGAVLSVTHEVLSSMRVVQAFTREEYEQTRFEKENEQRVIAGIHARTLQAKLKPLVEILVGIGTMAVLWFGARQVMAEQLSAGSLLVFLAYLSRLYKPMRELAKQSDILSRATVGLDRIFALLDTEQAVEDKPGAEKAGTLRGHIEFRNVAFAYPGGAGVLHGIDFEIEPGRTVALVGSTGSGKTTLVSLVPRFHDPASGSVRIDGRDAREFTLNSLRSQISLVLQDTVLFHGTIRDNIAYGKPDASEEEIVAASKAANAHEFVIAMPGGYDTVVAERGAMLSGGQRQRIAIARAIVRNAPIVILDEPTTGLDASSEALVMEGLERLVGNRTALIIAHRLSTVMRCDQILVLEQGRIVERGTHADLLTKQGRYAQLYALQFRGQEALSAPEEGGAVA